jgi:hypothetical protein
MYIYFSTIPKRLYLIAIHFNFYFTKTSMKHIFIILGVVFYLSLSFSACEKKVDGCMHPRAINFNPEADQDDDDVCVYYELSLQMQHYASSLANDTLIAGNWIYDADGVAFSIQNSPILVSNVHLFQGDQEFNSIETIDLYDMNGNIVRAEDNFFITLPGKYGANIGGWTHLGTFDSISFNIGLPENIRQTNPSRVYQYHPLSTSPSFYMYDSVSAGYQACRIDLVYDSTNQFNFKLIDDIQIKLPYNVTVVDGSNILINLRLDYLALFNGISFTNDSQTIIENKILQNFRGAFSTY